MNSKISIQQLWTLKAFVFTLMPMLWVFAAEPANYIFQWLSGYLIAIVIFYICYHFKDRFTDNKILSHFADISYPLYVVHALFGYAVMYVLVEMGAGTIASIAAASLASYLAAVMIHLLIEKPSLRWSKLGRQRLANTSAV